MDPHLTFDKGELYHGDALAVMAELGDESVHAIVTDPPYGLGFMGREWDALPPGKEWAAECLRVLKPGGYLASFGGSRTWHRLAVAIEDAGFEIRDSIAWLYGSGFPKSMDVSKAIDKLDAADVRLDRARRFQAWLRKYLTPQEVNAATNTDMGHHYTTHPTQPSVATVAHLDLLRPLLPDVPEWVEVMCRERTVESETFKRREVTGSRVMIDTSRVRLGFAGGTFGGDSSTRLVDLTAPATPEAKQWLGWGTALKPAFEPIILARKPLAGTVAANVLEHGTGALNIDGCRIGTSERLSYSKSTKKGATPLGTGATEQNPAGRWPANVIIDESAAAELDEQSGTLSSGANPTRRGADGERSVFGDFAGQADAHPRRGVDIGGASRFFYTAKASNAERPLVQGVRHPTVKPLDLMRWLVRLVTPPDGTVLDPFAGSGTTLEAARAEGFHSIGIEKEAEYLPLTEVRITRHTDPARALELNGEDPGLFALLRAEED